MRSGVCYSGDPSALKWLGHTPDSCQDKEKAGAWKSSEFWVEMGGHLEKKQLKVRESEGKSMTRLPHSVFSPLHALVLLTYVQSVTSCVGHLGS